MKMKLFHNDLTKEKQNNRREKKLIDKSLNQSLY